MTISINYNQKFIDEVEKHAKKNKRSIPKQIEYWTMIGKTCEENETLTYKFIKDVLSGQEEIKIGKIKKYKRRK